MAQRALTIDGLRKAYGGKTVLDGVSFEVPAGQMVGIVGRSGAGKSTLLRCINRLVEADAGAIGWDGLDVRALRGGALLDWRARCGMIFQQFQLVDRMDALTNVLLGSVRRRRTLPLLFRVFPAADRAKALELLQQLDLGPQAGQTVKTLSGGQQQRVAIAKVLMQGVEVLLADEPVSSLDPENTRIVMDQLRQLQRSGGVTVLCNLHNLEVARSYCDRVLGLSQGRLVFDGSPQELTAGREESIYAGAR
ncbi:MAG: phosphonate ABC transporter ATP-binding protein [Acidobacteriota bacterium]|jgi:phosphonate transport system ATP-binding protein